MDRLLDAARRGPSAGFSQGTDFLVLDDPAALARFWQLTDDPGFPRDPTELAIAPPVVVLAFSDPNRYIARYSQPDKLLFGLDRADAWPVKFWDTDTAMACILMLLAAVDARLGGGLFGVAHGEGASCAGSSACPTITTSSPPSCSATHLSTRGPQARPTR